MITQLQPDKKTDPEFIRLVNLIIRNVLIQNRPKDIYVIHRAKFAAQSISPDSTSSPGLLIR
jgi:hypothetical protein